MVYLSLGADYRQIEHDLICLCGVNDFSFVTVCPMLAPFPSGRQMSQQKAILRANGFTSNSFWRPRSRVHESGTDGVLLGGWAPVANVQRVLDIGTGSGLIALMMAQRTAESVNIDAVDWMRMAAAQAQENVAASPGREEYMCTRPILSNGRSARSALFVIVSNPPYFSPGSECASPESGFGRYTTI